MPRRYKICLKDPKTQVQLTAYAEGTDRQMLAHELFEGEKAVQGWIVTGIWDCRRDMALDLPVSEYTQGQVLRGVKGARENMCATLAGYYNRTQGAAVAEGLRTMYG
ncbi:MAG: hypothetical protein VX730_05825 [Pseudomonadota bacterium]|nr:hypothetical protein [Pseudomonadota bacterium]